VKLAWQVPSDNGGATIDRYRVERATIATGSWTTIARPTTRYYTASGLTNGTKYYFRVRAHSAAGWGPFSTAVNSVPRTVPTAPEAPYGTPGDSFVSLNWDSSSSTGGAAIDKYEAVVSTDQVNWTTPLTSTKWNNVGYDGLTNGTTYYFRVRAHNGAGWGPWSTIASATPRTVPSAPVAFWAYYDSIVDIIWVYWSPPANDGGATVDDYLIESSLDQSKWNSYSAQGTTSHGFKPGVSGTWYFRVKAHNDAGYGPYAYASVTIP
jgi:Fibronectin type III domain